MTLQFRFHLEEAAQKSGVAPDLIMLFVSRTWIMPVDGEHQVFDEEDVARIQLIRDLQDQMGINDEAIPVVMRLIDQLNRMHLQLQKPEA